MALWLAFIACTGLIVFSGSRLSKYGDILAEKSGLGRTWVGLVVMASVTSLPELVTGISSVTYANAPNIAVGDALGSCVFNVLILAMLDAFYRPGPLCSKAQQGNVLSAAFGVVLIGLAAAGLAGSGRLFVIGWVGATTVVAVLVYCIAQRLLFSYEKRQLTRYIKEMAFELKYEDVAMRTAIIHYIGNACVVIGAALFLPVIGKGIAESTGLGTTFVGNIFIAISTSLPEVVVSIAAVRIGAIDLAIGNLFGSNIFNVLILGIDDFFFVDGSLLAVADPGHLLSALSAMIMTAVAVIGLTYRAEKKTMFLAWDSIAIVSVYVLNLLMLSSI
jgi:cation:H+ antiporter